MCTEEKAEHPCLLRVLGADVDEIKDNVEKMYGPYRIPALLKNLDQLTRV
jgi:deoxyribonuclease V